MKQLNLPLIFIIIIAIGTGYYYYNYMYKKHDNLGQSSQIKINLENALDKKPVVPVAVIGSGPAGLSAALYTARSGFYTVVFQGPKPGGELTTTTYVENWPGTPKMLGKDLVEQNKKQAENFGAVIISDSIKSVDFSSWPYRLTTEEDKTLYALSVVIATGSTPKTLDVPGEKEFFGHGVTTCAICDAPFFKDKNVIVVGGGDSAVEEATLLVNYAKNVTVIVRGDSMRAASSMKQRLNASDKIKVIYNSHVTKIIGDNNKVSSVDIKNTKDNNTYNMPIDGVFLAIGHIPNTQMFKNYLKLDELGYIYLANRSQQTSMPGVYAAGDVSDHKYRQAGVAAGDGSKAGLDAIAFLQNIGFNEDIANQLERSYYEPEITVEPVKLKRIVTNQDFENLSKTKKPIIVEIGSSWCPPCRAFLPIVESVAAQLQEKAIFAQVYLDDNPKELVAKFNLEGKNQPALLIFKNNKLVDQYYGQVFSRRQLINIINNILD